VDVTRIIAEIDAQISKLQQARAALTGIGSSTATASVKRSGPGRPKGSTNLAKAAVPSAKVAAPKKKRRLSAEGRKRIADAMKKRWADRRKLQAKAK
jgi:hypothetical protein